MRLELTRVGLLAELANQYTTRGAFWNQEWIGKTLDGYFDSIFTYTHRYSTCNFNYMKHLLKNLSHQLF